MLLDLFIHWVTIWGVSQVLQAVYASQTFAAPQAWNGVLALEAGFFVRWGFASSLHMVGFAGLFNLFGARGVFAVFELLFLLIKLILKQMNIQMCWTLWWNWILSFLCVYINLFLNYGRFFLLDGAWIFHSWESGWALVFHQQLFGRESLSPRWRLLRASDHIVWYFFFLILVTRCVQVTWILIGLHYLTRIMISGSQSSIFFIEIFLCGIFFNISEERSLPLTRKVQLLLLILLDAPSHLVLKNIYRLRWRRDLIVDFWCWAIYATAFLVMV